MKRASIIALSLFLTLGCGSDTPPNTPSGSSSTGVSISPSLQRIAPGETVQLVATARYSDGSTRNVTTQASWTSSQVNVARIVAGALTGVAPGRAFIQTRFERWTGFLSIVTEPDGTFILKGRVTEAVQVGVGGAAVEVIGSAPNQVMTNSAGFYELFGVGGTSIVRVRKTGYFDESRSVTMAADQSLDVEITPRSPPASVAGSYRVTFTAVSCGILPAELKTRAYTASIDQNAAALLVTLSDAEFVSLLNQFTGGVSGDTVTFDLGGDYGYYYGPPVQERLPSGQTLGIFGTINAAATPQSISGALVGGFTLRTNTFQTCFSSNNQVVFTRQ